MKKLLYTAALGTILCAQTLAVTPEDIFAKVFEESAGNKTGITVRKGTIKALIDNVIFLNAEMSNSGSTVDLTQTLLDIKEAIVLLEDVYVFDTFPAGDWFESDKRPGNIIVGVYYLKQYPEKRTQTLKTQIQTLLEKDLHPLLQAELKTLI